MTNKFISYQKLIILCIFTIFCISIIPSTSVADIGPTPDFVEDSLEADVEPYVDSDDNKLSTNADITYNVSLEAQNSLNTYPYIYPIDLEIIEDDDVIETTTIFLTPTQSINYTPRYVDEDLLTGNQLSEEFSIYLAFNDQESSDINRDLTFNFESRLTDDAVELNKVNTISGVTPDGRTSSDLSVSQTSGFDEVSESTKVDNFRIHETDTNRQFLEDFVIPYSDDFRGEVQNFQYITESGSDGSTVIQSDGASGFEMVTLTKNIPRSEPHTLAITYNIFNGEELEVTPVDSSLNPIDPDTEYILPEDASDSEECQEISSTNNLCLFTLNSEEVDEINNLGEVFIEYESDEDISAELFCQSIITGYYSDSLSTCGSEGIINSDLVEIDTFEGKQNTESDIYDYTEENVPTRFNLDNNDYVTASIRNTILTNHNEDISVDIVVANEDDIDSEGIHDDVAVEQSFTLSPGENTGIDIDDKEIYFEDIIDTYKTIICPSGTYGTDDCTSENNIDSQSLNFVLDGNETLDMNLKSPIYVELTDELFSEELITERIQTQTTDNSYGDGNEWNQIDSESDFTGRIEERVTMNGLREADPSQYNTDAEERLSDINGDWVKDDYNSFVSVNESIRQYIPDNEFDAGGGWEPVSSTPERVAKVDRQSTRINVVDALDVQSIMDSERGWYIDRTRESEVRADSREETVLRHESPDDCYNCLTTENVTEAKNRYDETSGEVFIENQGEDNWERVSDEAIIISQSETGVTYNAPDAGASLPEGFVKILEDEEQDIWRQGEFDTRDVYEWRRTGDSYEMPFEAPVEQEISEYQYETYDIDYIYTGIIDDPSTLYTYQKDVTTELTEWEPELVWFDYSNIEESEDVNQVRVSYVGTSEEHVVDWHDSIHTYQPDNMDSRLDNVCDSGTINQEDVSGGTGGIGVIETCEIGSDEVITRIGKKYAEEGQYNPKITALSDYGNSISDTIDINVNEGNGVPEFEVDTVNDRVDYNIGKIAIEGNITAPRTNLDQAYNIKVSPSDSIDGLNNCPLRYNENEILDLQWQTTTTDTFIQTTNCVYESFDNLDDAPEQFIRYETNNDDEKTIYDIEEGAIQNCNSQKLGFGEDSDECTINNEYSTIDEGTETIDITGGDIDGEKFVADYCPTGYNLEESGNEAYCTLDDNNEFDLKSRQVSVDYQQIQRGVIQECEDIVTSSESGNHQGYENDADNGDEYCVLSDPVNDPGPSEFTLYNSDDDTYYAPPTGAVRGAPYDSDIDSIGRCEEFNINDDDEFTCQYDRFDNFDYQTTIKYASLTEGQWTYSTESQDNIDIDITESEGIIWQSDFIMDSDERFVEELIEPKEEFLTTLNPRQMGLSNEHIGENNMLELEFMLSPIGEDSSHVQSETIEVQLCAAPTEHTGNIPRESLDSPLGECNEFDSMMSGVDDFNESRLTLSDALDTYEETGESEYEIESVRNDLCPYNLRYPHNHDDIEPYEIDLEDKSYDEIKQDIEESLLNRYGPGGNPCDDEVGLATPTPESNTYSFDSQSFRDPRNVDNVRRIGAKDIRALNDDDFYSQALWMESELGDSLRLGSPVMTRERNSEYMEEPIQRLNEHLVAAYTFDHTGAGINHMDGKITDTYSNNLHIRDEELFDEMMNEDSDLEMYQQIRESPYLELDDQHHARLAFGTPCRDNNQITHEWADNNIGIDCNEDTLTREEVKNMEFDNYRGSGAFVEHLDGQSAILPYDPSEGIDSYDESSNYYDDGLFGGGAAVLDETSWLMITPPCIDRDDIGTEINSDEDAKGSGVCEFKGAVSNFYTDGGENMPDEKLTNKLSENYTISFWVKETSDTSPTDRIHEHPLKNIFGVSHPVTDEVITDTDPVDNIFDYVMGSDETAIERHFRTEPFVHTTYELNSMSAAFMKDFEDVEYYNTEQQGANNKANFLGSVYPEEQILNTDTSSYNHPISGWGSSYQKGEWTHVMIEVENIEYDIWGGVNDDEALLNLYINGQEQSTDEFGVPNLQRHGPIDSNTKYEDSFFVPTGEIYEDSVISLGARYLHSGQNQNGIYAPQIEASSGEIKIDDLRIYDETVTDVEPWNNGKTILDAMSLGEQNELNTEYSGTIESQPLTSDSKLKQIEPMSPLSPIEVYVDYSGEGDFEIDITPCLGDDSNDWSHSSSCIDSATTTVEKSTLNHQDTNSTMFNWNNVDWDNIEDKNDGVTNTDDIDGFDDIDEIESITMEVKLGSDDISKTPIINEIELEISDAPYQTCQELEKNHPSFSGTSDIINLGEIDERGDASQLEYYDAYCDMERGGGGWTQFYWATDNSDYDSSVYESLSDRSDILSSDCELNDDNCFSTANFDIPEYLSIDDFGEHKNIESEEELQPQLLIKSITDGSTDEWASFELRNIDEDVDASGLLNEIEFYFDGSRDNFHLNGEGCIYAFDGSQEYDSTNCINDYTFSPFSTRLSDSETDYDFVDISRDRDLDNVDDVTCLGNEDADKCEIYYRLGNAYPATDDDDFDIPESNVQTIYNRGDEPNWDEETGTFDTVNYEDDYLEIIAFAQGQDVYSDDVSSTYANVTTDNIDLAGTDRLFVDYTVEMSRRDDGVGNDETGFIQSYLMSENELDKFVIYEDEPHDYDSPNNKDTAFREGTLELDVSNVEEDRLRLESRAHSSNSGVVYFRVERIWVL